MVTLRVGILVRLEPAERLERAVARMAVRGGDPDRPGSRALDDDDLVGVRVERPERRGGERFAVEDDDAERDLRSRVAVVRHRVDAFRADERQVPVVDRDQVVARSPDAPHRPPERPWPDRLVDLEADDGRADARVEERPDDPVLGAFDVELEQVDPVVPELAHQRRHRADLGFEERVRVLQVDGRMRHVARIARREEPEARVLRPQSDGPEDEARLVGGVGGHEGDRARRRVEGEDRAAEALDHPEVERDVLPHPAA